MRVLRLVHGGIPYFAGLLDEATARLWTDAPWAGGAETDRLVPLRASQLLPPVTPTKIVCVGRNYRKHAEELGHDVPAEPLLFLKPPSALIGPGTAIELPPESERVEHEGELGVVIGSPVRGASPEEARSAIFGYTVVNDVTARDLQRRDVQFTRAKGFDTFCPCGPWIEPEVDPAALTIRVHVNGEIRQEGRTDAMIWPVAELVAYISRIMTLLPGDLVSTGTPAGVGPLKDGDRVTVEVEGIGKLDNPVASRPR